MEEAQKAHKPHGIGIITGTTTILEDTIVTVLLPNTNIYESNRKMVAPIAGCRFTL